MNQRPKPIKLLEGNTRKKLHDIVFCNFLSTMKKQAMKEKNKQLHQNFVHQRTQLTVKRQLME